MFTNHLVEHSWITLRLVIDRLGVSINASAKRTTATTNHHPRVGRLGPISKVYER